jgi:ribosomal protein S18 acetylase RimI-like enzyme
VDHPKQGRHVTTTNHDTAINYRENPRPDDLERVRQLVASSGIFSAEEVLLATELVHERLTRGTASGYYFLFAETAECVVGYGCFGPIPCTTGSFDLYWIAIHERFRRSGIGKRLLRRIEEAIHQRGGRRIYVETSSRESYRPTRAFYEVCGYQRVAVLEDFYSPRDAKLIYVKIL